MKVNVTLNDDLLRKIDKYVEENYMTRSGFVAFACNQFLAQAELLAVLKNCNSALATIARTGNCDPESMQKLQEFTVLASIALGDNQT